jgi:hypothetical protein
VTFTLLPPRETTPNAYVGRALNGVVVLPNAVAIHRQSRTVFLSAFLSAVD